MRPVSPSPECPQQARAEEQSLFSFPPPPSGSRRPPERLGGYEVLGLLGEGGMGVVYQARHPATRRLVAIKLMRDGLHGPERAGRFRREADALTRLRHANVVQLLEAGEHQGRPYFVMELVTGGSLAEALDGRPQPPGQAAAQVEVLARTVQAAHSAGIVHRDLKPANVLLTEEGALKLTDFGLAKLDRVTAHTATGQLMGSVPYMAPEQARGHSHRATPATDVWALGVILYEMLTGQRPFRGSGPLEVLEKVCLEGPLPPRQLRPELDRDLEAICLKCLHKEPNRRYASAGEVADDLRRFQEGRPLAAGRVGATERLAQWRRRHPAAAALALLGLVLALGAGAGWLWYWDRYQRLKVEYYAQTVVRFGAREGLGRLSEQEARGRRVSYKFYRRGGRVVQVDVVNGRGELTGEQAGTGPQRGSTGRECRYVYEWKPDGALLEERAEDRHGNLVWALRYTTPALARWTRGHGGATWVRLVWSEDGLPVEAHYRDGNGRPAPFGGVFGVRLEHDERGLVAREVYLGAGGCRRQHRGDGVAAVARRHDGRGNEVEIACFDADGRPCLNGDGYHRTVRRYDGRGNLVAVACFGTDGRPCLNRAGQHRAAVSYDEQGAVVEVAYFGVGGRAGQASIGPDGRPLLAFLFTPNMWVFRRIDSFAPRAGRTGA